MSMRKSRTERRKARAAVLGRVATAASFAPIRSRRASKARRSNARTLLAAAAMVAILGITLVATPKRAKAAGEFTVPEIDPGSMASALTLLSGGVLMLTDRSRRARQA